jgi:hypothetical protein
MMQGIGFAYLVLTPFSAGYSTIRPHKSGMAYKAKGRKEEFSGL